MSFHPERINVNLPNSQIKSPGMLFKDKKDPFEVRMKEETIQKLLTGFQNQIESPFSSISELPLIPTEGTLVKTQRNLVDNLLKSFQNATILGPGQLKKTSDKIAGLTQRTSELLSIYNLELNVKDSKVTKPIYNLLKILTPEICFFPSNFFEKLQVKEIMVADAQCDEDFSVGTILLCADVLDTRKKLREGLYEGIFNHLIIANPQIIRLLHGSETEKPDNAIKENQDRLKKTFLDLMNNTSHALLRPEVRKLREILAKYYPDAMSEQRFKQQYKQKKKTYRVRFDTEPESTKSESRQFVDFTGSLLKW